MELLKLKVQKPSRGMFPLIKSSTQVSMTRTNCKQRLPDTYIIKDYANVVKFLEITSNSTQNRQKIHYKKRKTLKN